LEISLTKQGSISSDDLHTILQKKTRNKSYGSSINVHNINAYKYYITYGIETIHKISKQPHQSAIVT